MSASIISCPSCKSLILSDTKVCPSCGHQRGAGKQQAPELQPAALPSQAPEAPCQHCGEMVRNGLVRCWKCGNFLRDEIAQLYEQMMAGERPVIYSQIGEEGADYVAQEGDFDLDDEMGFELSVDQFMTPSTGGQDYTLGERMARPQEESDTFALQEPEQPATQPAATATTTPDAVPQPVAETVAPAASNATESSEGDGIPHSEKTAGDALLNIAMAEEKESAHRRKNRKRTLRSADGFVIFCPNGHRIEVREHHRGKTGRCPKCESMFVVPLAPVKPPEPEQPAEGEAGPAAAGEAAANSSGQYEVWLKNVGLHTLDPAKLKLKAGSMATPNDTVDIGFSTEGMLIVTLAKAGGLFAGSIDKKRDAARETLLAYLKEGKPVGPELPVVSHQSIIPEQVATELKIVQPAPYAHESMFAGIPVFGEGKIAVRIPSLEGSTEHRFLSFFLSGYRELARELSRCFGITNFGLELGLPLEDTFTELKCHYTEKVLPVLDKVEYYEPDPTIPLEIIGWRCGGCQLIVTEDARKKEKIGGKTPSSVAKAKCPKCKQKFGNNPLTTLQGKMAESATPMA